jgi:hypothetical protein
MDLRTVLAEKFGLRGVPLDAVLSLDAPIFSRDSLVELVSAALRPDTEISSGFGSRECSLIATCINENQNDDSCSSVQLVSCHVPRHRG